MKSVKVITFLTLCFSTFCESKLCYDEGITWSSDGLLSFIPQILSPEECIKLCLEQDNCNGYTWHGQYNKRLRFVQCNLDLVATCDLVTILQRPFFHLVA